MTRSPRFPRPQLFQRISRPCPHANRHPVPHGRRRARRFLRAVVRVRLRGDRIVPSRADTVPLCLVAAALPGWLLRAALLGAVGVPAAGVVRGFKAQFEGCREAEGPSEEWCEDARCMWRVLRGAGDPEGVGWWGSGEGGVSLHAKPLDAVHKFIFHSRLIRFNPPSSECPVY
ncbi:hypothetical protein EI94DRAFT_1724859 [Lactarius quietus]|nr:hypothetical protein EI94DRAFT_1724859 [Lactarius quietus]